MTVNLLLANVKYVILSIKDDTQNILEEYLTKGFYRK